MTDDFQVTSEGAGMVRIRTDAPGERATSTTVNAQDAILAIAQAGGLRVEIMPPAEDEAELPPQATQLPADTASDAPGEAGLLVEVDLGEPQPGEPQVGEDTPEVPIEGEDEDPPAF